MRSDVQCCEMIWHGFHENRCSRKGKITRNGKWYCRQHDPEFIAAKLAARDEEAEEESRVFAQQRIREARKQEIARWILQNKSRFQSCEMMQVVDLAELIHVPDQIGEKR